jgi:hypothetical protein
VWCFRHGAYSFRVYVACCADSFSESS